MFIQPVKPTRHNLLLWIAFTLLLFSWAIDLRYLQPALITPTPRLEAEYLLRSTLLMVTGGLFVAALLRRARPLQPPAGEPQPLLLALAPWGSLAFGAASLALFLIAPHLFASAGYEDRPVEYLSAIGLFVAAGLLTLVAIRLFKIAIPFRNVLGIICLLMAVGFFVTGMEEVSWFQRVIGFDTPDAFAGNRQGEFNFHNFASNIVEELYYLGGFFLLIVVPFLADIMPLPRWLQPLRLVMPGPVVFGSSALMAAFNYHLWNRTSTQVICFATLTILLFYTWRAFRQNGIGWSARLLPSALLLVFVAAQALFLLHGHTLPAPWLVSEYKELLLPVGFCVYALEVVGKSNRLLDVAYRFQPGL